MPTETQQRHLTEAFELAEERGFGTGGWLNIEGEWSHGKGTFGERDIVSYPVDWATDEHYEAACWRAARWLREKHCAYVYPSHMPIDKFGNTTAVWKLSRVHNTASCLLDCDDDPLAALNAAMREVGQ